MRAPQGENEIGDAGAVRLVEGLRVNSSLQQLSLVRLFVYCLFLWGDAGRGRGGGRLHSYVCCSTKIE